MLEEPANPGGGALCSAPLEPVTVGLFSRPHRRGKRSKSGGTPDGCGGMKAVVGQRLAAFWEMAVPRQFIFGGAIGMEFCGYLTGRCEGPEAG